MGRAKARPPQHTPHCRVSPNTRITIGRSCSKRVSPRSRWPLGLPGGWAHSENISRTLDRFDINKYDGFGNLKSLRISTRAPRTEPRSTGTCFNFKHQHSHWQSRVLGKGISSRRCRPSLYGQKGGQISNVLQVMSSRTCGAPPTLKIFGMWFLARSIISNASTTS